MEYYSWEEGQELTLFGGELPLLNLGSPIELEVVPPVQYGVKEAGATIAPAFSKKEPVCTSVKQEHHAGDTPSVFSDDWLDTQLDLQGLLQTPALAQLSPASPPESTACSAQELYDSICVDSGLSLTSSPMASGLNASQVSLGLDVSQTSLGLDVSQTSLDSGLELDLSGLEGSGQDCSQLLAEVLSKLTEYVGQDVSAERAAVSSYEQSALSPVSVDDIESLLSDPSSPQAVPTEGPSELELLLTSGQVTPVSRPHSGQMTPVSRSSSGQVTPSSSRASASFSAADSDSDYAPVLEPRSKKQRAKPYSREKQPADKKERKKVQNKTAALKYRQKKRGESDNMFTECDELEDRNKQLKNKVESMTREIQYLKDLMAEVLVARKANTN